MSIRSASAVVFVIMVLFIAFGPLVSDALVPASQRSEAASQMIILAVGFGRIGAFWAAIMTAVAFFITKGERI